ncbi:MAG: hypothetical protein KGI02_09155 [Thaumarchaeota archaeon]|nr:hypothetical protein [Nitrososphaerota archaeon]
MKILHLAIIIVVAIALTVIASAYIIFNPIIHPASTDIVGFVRSNQTGIPSVSNIIIPAGAEDPSSGKNYEPRYLVVVLGVNNTVRWTNESPSAAHTVVAENQDDPLFWNVTRSSSVLLPGKSFNFTFTKAGEFQYDTEPHPWMYGWVLVLPQSAKNVIQTVTLNASSGIPDPCETFGMPCPYHPSNYNFTAQRLGSNIYIEKFTGDSVDYYALIHNSKVCKFSTNYGGSCSNPDDLAILRFIGVDTSVPKQYADISITGLHQHYVVGEPIDFQIHIQGYGPCDFPSVSIIHGNNTVWKGKSGAVSCPYPIQRLSERYDLESLGGPFYLNQSGAYALQVKYDSNMTEQRFGVVSQEGSSMIPLIYPNGTYTGFSANYNITGDNNLLGATLDNKSGTIIMLTRAVEGGNLTITLMQDLVNIVDHGKQENQLLVLTDGQLTKYKEHTQNQNVIMTIPFHSGAKKIEIVMPEPV